MRRAYLYCRHLGCGALALLLIAAGKARAARARLVQTNDVTCIYFHNPRRRLFRICMEWLSREGYTFVSEATLIRILSGETVAPPRAVWVSLDDGYIEWLTEVVPVARALKIPLTLFISPGLVDGNGLLPWYHDDSYPHYKGPPLGRSPDASGREVISVEQLRDLSRQEGISIGGHTVTHTLMPLCPDHQLEQEVAGCRKRLEELTGTPVVSFAYPAGQYDGRSRHYLRTGGYRMAATTKAHFAAPGGDLLLVPRFCVPDGVTFPEAVCNMLGIWHPLMDRVKALLGMGDPGIPQGEVVDGGS